MNFDDDQILCLYVMNIKEILSSKMFVQENVTWYKNSHYNIIDLQNKSDHIIENQLPLVLCKH